MLNPYAGAFGFVQKPEESTQLFCQGDLLLYLPTIQSVNLD
jgi:hypothetical protein